MSEDEEERKMNKNSDLCVNIYENMDGVTFEPCDEEEGCGFGPCSLLDDVCW